MNKKYFNFKDKVVFIVGGSSGIGLELAKAFYSDGSQVIIASRNKSNLKHAVLEFKDSAQKKPYEICLDVRKVTSIEKACDIIIRQFKKIDIVICAAGTYLKKEALKTTPEDWKSIIDTNLTGTFNLNLTVGKFMVKQKKGSIINISSLGAKISMSNTIAYSVSKSGVEMITKSLASEWAKYNVRVNSILPGVFKTKLNAKALKDSIRAKNIINKTPMNRFGHLNELVTSAMFLASDESSFVTGTSIAVDGGFLAYGGF